MPPTLEISVGEATVIIGGIALAGGILAWWIAKFLDDKKDSTIHSIKIQDIENDIKNLQDRVTYLERKGHL